MNTMVLRRNAVITSTARRISNGIFPCRQPPTTLLSHKPTILRTTTRLSRRLRQRQRRQQFRYDSSSAAASDAAAAAAVHHHHHQQLPPLRSSLTIPPPTPLQLRRHFWISAVPFVAFGFMDNTVMIQAGNFIDCSIGVLLGLSTLAAAAIGQIVSSGVSVAFGGYVESLARRAGLPSAGFTSAQRQLTSVRRVAMLGNLFGVVIGATLGLLNLLLIDTSRSTHLKLDALTEEQEFAFEVEVSNTTRKDATVLTVRGPDVDGILASLTCAIVEFGCTLVELHASPRSSGYIEDVFIVRPRGHLHFQIDDNELDDLARKMLAASRDPLSAHTLKTQVQKLQAKNDRLRQRVDKLVHKLEDRHITIDTMTALRNGSDVERSGATAMDETGVNNEEGDDDDEDYSTSDEAR